MGKKVKPRLYDFRWHVPEAGYQWTKVEVQRQVWSVLEPAGRKERHYEPLKEYKTLFREFASTPPTPEGVLAFANRYGPLGVLTDGVHRLHPAVARLKGIPGERFEVWCKEINTLKAAVDLWDMVQQEDEAGLSRHIRWSPDKKSVCLTHLPDKKSVDDDFLEEFPDPDLFSPGEVIRPALFYVQSLVNRVLGDNERVSPQLVYDEQRGRMVLSLLPETLLGALWLQFAQAIGGNKEYRACHVCGKWFEVSPEMTRSDRRTCSDSCRSKAYRERKDWAVRLAAEGKTPKEIAEELDSDVKTVKGWIKQRKG
jgi:hypothetical protein